MNFDEWIKREGKMVSDEWRVPPQSVSPRYIRNDRSGLLGAMEDAHNITKLGMYIDDKQSSAFIEHTHKTFSPIRVPRADIGLDDFFGYSQDSKQPTKEYIFRPHYFKRIDNNSFWYTLKINILKFISKMLGNRRHATNF